MGMALTFHTKDPNRVGDVLNIFLFPDLSPIVRVKSGLPHAEVGRNLGVSTLTYVTETSILTGKEKVASIVIWDKASSQLEAWAVFCTVFLVYDGLHPAQIR